jgi:hypothetical protein
MTNLPNSGQANSLDNFNVDRADYRQSMENLLAFLAQGLGGVTGAYGTQTVDPAAIKLSGLPTAPTAAAGTNTTQLATTAFVKGELSNSPVFTGTPTAPTAAVGTNTTQIATTAFVEAARVWTRTGTALAPKTSGDVVSISAGTALLPGLTPVGDPDTGLYAPAANTLALATGGAERIHLSSIGVAVPDKLFIGQTKAISGSTTQAAEFNGSVVINSKTAGAGGKAVLEFSHLTSNPAVTRGGAAVSSEAAGPYTAGTLITYDADLVLSSAIDGAVTEGARLTSSGYLRMAAGTKGIQFNGDTAAANALNDYEEGTFTPTVIGATTAGTATYAAQVGTYIKIGKLVWMSLTLNWSAGTGAGDLQITGLPFTSISNHAPGLSVGMVNGLTLAANSYLFARVESGSSKVGVYDSPTGGGTNAKVAYDAAASLTLSGCYYASA